MPSNGLVSKLFRRNRRPNDSHMSTEGNTIESQRASGPSPIEVSPLSRNATRQTMTAGVCHQPTCVSSVQASVDLQNSVPAHSGAGTLTSHPQMSAADSVLPPSSSTTSLDSTASDPLFLPEILWDQAYDNLKVHESSLVMAYEKVLTRELKNETGANEAEANAIDEIPEKRRLQMRALAQAGLKKIETEAKVKKNIGTVIQTVVDLNSILSSALQSVPQASLAWTGVCFALQIFLNPPNQSMANRYGIEYVIRRVEWYWALSELLFKEDISQADRYSFKELQCQLKDRIVDLYQKLLSYQMKSVCSYYRNRGLAVCRDLVKLDDWDGSFKAVQAAEDLFRRDSRIYESLQSNENLKKLVETATNQEIKLDTREDLKCLQDLCLTNPAHDMIRIEETKGGLLKDAYKWILDQDDFISWRDKDEPQLLWIKGDPGKGKTMLLIGIVKELNAMHNRGLLSYFFCQATDMRLNTSTAILRGLTYQLVDQQYSLMSHVRSRYEKNKQLFEGNNAFIALREIFIDMLLDVDTPVYLVIDALDECTSGLSQLLKLIIKTSSISLRVKWLISSRYNWEIENDLTRAGIVEVSLELNAKSVSGAVSAYINHKVSELTQVKRYKPELSEQVRNELSKSANGTFLWVALVCQELRKVGKWRAIEWIQKVPADLTLLYDRMMKQIEGSDDRSYCIQILSIAVLAYRPLDLSELAALAGLPKEISSEDENLREIISTCGSFLTIQNEFVYFIHQSAKDYLSVSEKMCPNGRIEIHKGIVTRSLQGMEETLHRDMYNLQDPGILMDQVNTVNPDPLAPIRYSCAHWINHLCEIDSPSYLQQSLCDNGEVHRFMTKLFLYWLEALSLMRNMSNGVKNMRTLQNFLVDMTHRSQLLPLVRDSLRFVLRNKWVIENAPLQIYASSLVFSPTSSLTRVQWKREEPYWIITKPIVESDWTPCLLTLEHHSWCVSSVVFSHDSRRLGSGSSDGTVKIWDAETGDCVKVLQGHGDYVSSVAFSHDSQVLASGSWDLTVKVWDTGTGECLNTMEGHKKKIWSVAFSQNSLLIASSSSDGMVKIWDAKTGKCWRTLESHGQTIRSVVFSHDSKRVASASDNGTVEIWDTGTGDCLKSLANHGGSASSVAFSHDSRRFAYSLNNTIKILDAETCECLNNLRDCHSEFILSVMFSHDSRLLASASMDGTVRVWDVKTGNYLKQFEDHGDVVESVIFSHDSLRLASASRDGTVKVWDVTMNVVTQRLQGHKHLVKSVIFSHDLQWMASGSCDGTAKVWDSNTGNCLTTLIGHKYAIQAITFSHCSQRLASASMDATVRVWDSVTGNCLNTLACSNEAWSVVFSHDSLLIASGSWDGTVRIWDSITGECKKILDSHRRFATSVVFSHDSLHLASASWDCTVRIWDATTGECIQTLEGHKDSIDTATFSHDSRRVASGSADRRVKIWDVQSGECLKTLEGHLGRVISVVFSRDSKHISTASDDSTVKVWDSWTGECIKTLESHGAQVHSLVFPHDSSTCERVPDVNQMVASPETSNATITLEENAIQKAKWHGYSLSSDGSWIKWYGRNQLWLPSEYRAASFAVSGDIIAIGCGSGRVIILQLSPTMMYNQ